MNKDDKFTTTLRQGTLSVWAGERERFENGVTQIPVVNGVTYAYKDIDEWYSVAQGKSRGYIYSRNTNPTVEVFEEKVRVLEKAEAATSFSTGMAAISNTFFALLKPGDQVVSIKDTYGGTSKIFLDDFPRFNIKAELCNTTDYNSTEKQILKGCKLVYLETPTNPTVKILDLKRFIHAAKKVGAMVVVDNTFATPINQNPLELGADLVLHSATKFLGGHSDAMGGVVCGKKKLVDRIFHFREINGATLDANSAYNLIKGLKTLELRIERQNSNALQLAQFLQNHNEIEKVNYPGLETHLNHDIAKVQMKGFGGVLSFSLKGGFQQVRRVLPKLKNVYMAAHLGGLETTVGPPKVTSHVENTQKEREQLGIPEGLVRCSVGIENIEDIIKDFSQALQT